MKSLECLPSLSLQRLLDKISWLNFKICVRFGNKQTERKTLQLSFDFFSREMNYLYWSTIIFSEWKQVKNKPSELRLSKICICSWSTQHFRILPQSKGPISTFQDSFWHSFPSPQVPHHFPFSEIFSVVMDKCCIPIISFQHGISSLHFSIAYISKGSITSTCHSKWQQLRFIISVVLSILIPKLFSRL